MAQKASVDKSLCIACGACITSCPDCFVWGDDGKSEYKEGPQGAVCNLSEIADDCPVMAITVEEE